MGTLKRFLVFLLCFALLLGDSQAGALKLFINLDAKSPEEALVESFFSRNSPSEIIYTRDDLRSVELHFLEEDENDAQRPFRYVDPAAWNAVKFAAGTRDLIPLGGTFMITDVDAGQTTGAIAYNAAASAVQTAVQAGLTANFSTAVVADVTTGVWTIDRTATGAFTGALTITATALTPAGSTGFVINTEDGTASLSEKWQLGLSRAHPILRTTGWSALSSASVNVTTVQTGSASANEVYRVQYNADAYGGAVVLAFTGDTVTGTVTWAFDASSEEVVTAWEAHMDVEDDGVAVVKSGPGDYTIELVGAGIRASATPALATASNTLQVPVGLTASLSSNTALVTTLLGSADTAEVLTEVEISRDSGSPETVVQVDSELSRDLIRNTPGSSTGLEQWVQLQDLFITGDDDEIWIGNAMFGDGSPIVSMTAVDGVFNGSFTLASDVNLTIGGDAYIQIPTGSAPFPSMRFAGIDDTGIYSPGADQVGIAANGVNAATFTENGLPLRAPITTKTGTYTLTETDFTILADATSGAFDLDLPPAASHPGRIYVAKKIDASGNAVTLDGNASETIDGIGTKTLSAQYQALTIQSNGVNWHILNDF